VSRFHWGLWEEIKMTEQHGPADVLMRVAGLDKWQPRPNSTPIDIDAELAGMFRTMLMDRYSFRRISDDLAGGATPNEVIAQSDPLAEEKTVATVVSAAVWYAADGLNEPDLAAQVAHEGVLSAMRFPKYATKKREYETYE
jgi:hypothetical protein